MSKVDFHEAEGGFDSISFGEKGLRRSKNAEKGPDSGGQGVS